MDPFLCREQKNNTFSLEREPKNQANIGLRVVPVFPSGIVVNRNASARDASLAWSDFHALLRFACFTDP